MSQITSHLRLPRLAIAVSGAATMLTCAGVALASPVAPPVSPVAKGASIQLSSTRPVAGSTVTLSGDAPLDARAGCWLWLESTAFASDRRAVGVPAVRTQVSAQGTYRVTATLRRDLTPGVRYIVSGTYDGEGFPSQPSMMVRSSQTGASIQAPTGRVTPGQTIVITGDAPRDGRAGRWITLTSPAFASTRTLGGVPAIRTQISAQGTYRISVRVTPGTADDGLATITGWFAGQQFPRSVTLHINAGLDGTLHVVYHDARGTAAPGTPVILVGDAPSSAPGPIHFGDTLTFTSPAFARPVTALISAQGTYRTHATIAAGVTPGTYAVTGSFDHFDFATGGVVKVVR